MFLILINGAGFENLQRNVAANICNPRINKRRPVDRIHVKWIDNMTAAEAVNLRKCLVDQTSPQQHPLTYHERTGHVLPVESSKIQHLLNDLLQYTAKHEMKVNDAKTNVILFNRSKNYDFLPRLTIGQSEPLKVVEEIKILGIIVRSDLSWASNTRAICSKAYSRLWILRRLKPLGVSKSQLLDVYDKQVRCIVEFACPVWTGGITQGEVLQIERVQKAAFAIILGKEYKSYECALINLGRSSLVDRRLEISTKFAKKCRTNPRFSHWFSAATHRTNINTRSKKSQLAPVCARTKSFEKSPLAYLTNLLRELL